MTNTSASRAARLVPVALLLGALLLAGGTGTALAASQVSIEARALVGGRYEVGGWVAIAVSLVNEGAPTEGSLVAEGEDGIISRFVEMPAGANKVVMLYVAPEAFQRSVTVRYDEPNGDVQATVEVRVLEQSNDQYVTVGDGAGTLRPQLSTGDDLGVPEPLSLATADLPERPEPLSGIAAMVWAGDSSALGEGQRRALERWVADGGNLVVIGGPDWQARTAAFADLLPVEGMAAIDDVALDGLAAWAGSDAAPMPAATVSAGTLRDDAVAIVTADDGTVLASMRSVGAGRVILLGADFATDEFRGWDGSPRLWSRLLPTGAVFEQFFGGGMPPQEAESSIAQAIGNIPSLEVPGAELLLVMIVAYILLIGPISYVILRRLDRREMAWITAPLLVVLFTACSYGVGSAMKGSDVIVNEIALIRTSSAGQTAMVQTYAGVFSPDRRSYSLSVDADALISPIRANIFGDDRPTTPVVLEQGQPARVRDLSVGVFGFETVRADAVIEHAPSLEVTWRHEGDTLVGTVTNIGDQPLDEVAYVSTSDGEMVGRLEPGATAEFEVARVNFNGSSASDQVYGFGGFDESDANARRTIVRRSIIDSLVGYGAFMPGGADVVLGGSSGPFVIGWRDEAGPLAFTIEETVAQHYTQSVEVLAVRPDVASGGELTIGPAQMSSQVIASEGDVSSGGPGTVSLGNGSVTYGIALPLEASAMAVSELEVIVGPDPSMVLNEPGGFGGFWPPGFVAEIRDPRSGEWTELGDLSNGGRFEIDDPATAISASGRMEVRVTGTDVPADFGQSSIFVTAQASGVLSR